MHSARPKLQLFSHKYTGPQAQCSVFGMLCEQAHKCGYIVWMPVGAIKTWMQTHDPSHECASNTKPSNNNILRLPAYTLSSQTLCGRHNTIQEQKFIKPKQISRPGPTFTFFLYTMPLFPSRSATTHSLLQPTAVLNLPKQFYVWVSVCCKQKWKLLCCFLFISMAVIGMLYYFTFLSVAFMCVSMCVCSCPFISSQYYKCWSHFTYYTWYLFRFWWISAPAQ